MELLYRFLFLVLLVILYACFYLQRKICVEIHKTGWLAKVVFVTYLKVCLHKYNGVYTV